VQSTHSPSKEVELGLSRRQPCTHKVNLLDLRFVCPLPPILFLGWFRIVELVMSPLLFMLLIFQRYSR
jgi:hypothetical protein